MTEETTATPPAEAVAGAAGAEGAGQEATEATEPTMGERFAAMFKGKGPVRSSVLQREEAAAEREAVAAAEAAKVDADDDDDPDDPEDADEGGGDGADTAQRPPEENRTGSDRESRTPSPRSNR